MKNIKLIIGAVALLVIIILASVMYNDLTGSYIPENIQGGEELQRAEFSVADESGKKISFSEFSGKPSVINLWATWCPYCIEELPDFQNAFDKYKDKVNFLMVNATDGREETVEKASAFIKEGGYTFPVYYDVYSEAAITFGASSLPMTFFTDSQGNIITYARGKINAEALEKGIQLILEK